MGRVLITGAAGFVGRHSVETFVEAGWQVLAMVHRAASPALDALAAAGRVEIVRSDVADRDRLMRDLAAASVSAHGLDVIVHCAARTSDVGWRYLFRRANVDGVAHIVEVAERLDVARLVHVSTTDVYGIRDFHGEGEDKLPLSGRERDPYAWSKIAAERLIRARLDPTRWAIVRPASIWGLGDPHVTQRVVDFLRWSPWIPHASRWRGRNRAPLAHVRNVASALYLAATRPEVAGQAINVLDPEYTTNDEFFRMLGAAYLPGKRFANVIVPTGLGMAIGVVVTAVSNLLGRDEALTDPSLYSARLTSSHLHFDNSRFLTLMRLGGRKLVSRETGLRELVEDGVLQRVAALAEAGRTLAANGELTPPPRCATGESA